MRTLICRVCNAISKDTHIKWYLDKAIPLKSWVPMCDFCYNKATFPGGSDRLRELNIEGAFDIRIKPEIPED